MPGLNGWNIEHGLTLIWYIIVVVSTRMVETWEYLGGQISIKLPNWVVVLWYHGVVFIEGTKVVFKWRDLVSTNQWQSLN